MRLLSDTGSPHLLAVEIKGKNTLLLEKHKHQRAVGGRCTRSIAVQSLESAKGDLRRTTQCTVPKDFAVRSLQADQMTFQRPWISRVGFAEPIPGIASDKDPVSPDNWARTARSR